MKLIIFLFVVYSTVHCQTIQDVVIEDITVGYEENSLLITWAESTGIPLWFTIFYAEAENSRLDLLDSALAHGMSFEECFDWEASRTFKKQIRITPQSVFQPFTSTIRIAIMPSTHDHQYGKLFLAPDILNKTPQRVVVKIK